MGPLNTQKTNVEAVINGKGDYVVALKQNQETFYEDVKLYFDDYKLEIMRASGTKNAYLRQVEKSHSSIVTYEYFQTEDREWYSAYKEWKGFKSIGVVRKTIEKEQEVVVENRYYISSLFNDIDLFSESIRKHWSVENKLHWQLDFTFKQDNNTTMNKTALFNLQIIKKFSLSLLNYSKTIYDRSLKLILLRLSLDFEHEILQFFNIISR